MGAIELRDVRGVSHTSTGTLRRQAKEVVAVDGLSLDIREGELFRLLRPDRAGRSAFGTWRRRRSARGTLEV